MKNSKSKLFYTHTKLSKNKKIDIFFHNIHKHTYKNLKATFFKMTSYSTLNVKIVTKTKISGAGLKFSQETKIHEFMEEMCKKEGLPIKTSYLQVVKNGKKGIIIPYDPEEIDTSLEETFSSLGIENFSDFRIVCKKE